MRFEIGDSFKIVNSSDFHYNCSDQKEFIIESFSVSGLSIYYIDTYKNKNCRCINCSKKIGIKCISLRNIELVSKRVKIERDLKLKELGI